MTPERWKRIGELFDAALEVEPEGRAVWIEAQCAGDPAMRAEVEALLAADAKGPELLNTAISEEVRSIHEGAGRTGQLAGAYEILSKLGSGGMGTVYLARRADDVFRKEVAVKIVRGIGSEEMQQRFRYERQILARLEHPYIVGVIDGGTTADGLPYLVMDYVNGLPISDYCERHGLNVDRRLDLFRKVCAAVEYAHQNLIVHRDLKPSNILVEDSGSPKLLDFGIAKMLSAEPEKSVLTQTLRMITPQYASPEQVKGEPITTASDIYSLGAVLYELLARTPAHRITSNDPTELARVICEKPIAPPSVAARKASEESAGTPLKVGADLDKIVLMAMQTERRMRYSSVQHFSEDLRRYMENRPVAARSPTFRYRAAKFMRRHRVSVAACVAVAASLVGATLVSTHQARRAERRFQEVRGLANTFLFDIHDQIQALPGSTLVRESIVKTSLEYLDRLAGESGDDRSLQYELASAYQRIGDVQGYPVRPNLGRPEAALASYQKALVLATGLAERDTDPVLHRLVARIHGRIGYVQTDERKDVDREHFGHGLAIAERLYAMQPGSSEDAQIVVELSVQVGQLELTMGNLAAARENLARAVSIAKRWVDLSPGEDSRAALGLGLRWLSRALASSGDLTAALEQARQSVAMREALLAAQPVNVRRRRDVMNSYGEMARLLGRPDVLNLGDHTGALETSRKAIAIAEELARADPNNRMAQSDLVIELETACEILLERDPRASAETCQRALDLVEAITRRFNPQEQLWISTSTHLADAQRKLGQPAKSLETSRAALEAQKRLAPANTSRVDHRQNLVRSYNQIGAAQVDLGRVKEAIEDHRQALAIAEDLSRGRPSDMLLRRSLADCYEALGRAYAALANKTGPHSERREHWRWACDWHRKSLAIWSQWRRWGVSSIYDTRRKDRAAAEVARCEAALTRD
ncbi:MAG: protein kinase domain-containing protein [Bryobacteraceae bacterium]